MEGVELEFKEAALHLIAKKSLAKKIGARGLRATLENILLDTMYDLPSLEGVAKVIVDENAVNNSGKPIVIYENEDKKVS